MSENTAYSQTAGMYTSGATAGVVNNIFWGNHDGLASELIFADGAPVAGVEYNDIQGLPGGYPASNIDEDPSFSDATAHDYHIEPGACVDTGFTIDLVAYPFIQSDLDGLLRPYPLDDGLFDMGAYEYHGE